MSGIKRPYRRTARAFLNGCYFGGSIRYIRHSKFAEDRQMYIRGFLLLQKDLEHLFEYIEPVDANLQCYSFRVYEILLRACIEIEANCKAILRDNAYSKTKKLNMSDYKKIEESHRLSGFEVRLPVWHGLRSNEIRAPSSLGGQAHRCRGIKPTIRRSMTGAQHSRMQPSNMQ